ncbi:MAG: DUF302 domain-containing protein [Candidatus Methanosuratincola sp.]|jgi:uncharacterized protein (DUF302 family)
MIYVVESRKSLGELSRALEESVVRNKFGILGVHNLKEAMEKKGVEFGKECIIYEVCNPNQAKKVLEANLEISTALPCRISLYVEGDRTKLATIKPTAMLALFPNRELMDVAREVEETIVRIMEEAAG